MLKILFLTSLLISSLFLGCSDVNNKQNPKQNPKQNTNILQEMQKLTEVCDRYGYVYYIGFRMTVPVTSPVTHKHMTCKEYRLRKFKDLK